MLMNQTLSLTYPLNQVDSWIRGLQFRKNGLKKQSFDGVLQNSFTEASNICSKYLKKFYVVFQLSYC